MSKFSPRQIEELKQIGSYLCQQRELRSLTIEEIAGGTFVRQPLLEAIEAGNVERLPEVIYVQGFIRRYGDFLGFDGNALAHQLTRTSLFTPDDITPEMVALPVAPEAQESLSAVPRDRTSKVPIRKMRSENPLLLTDNTPKLNFLAQLSPYWLYGLVLLAAIAGLYSLFVRPTPQPMPTATTSTPRKTATAPVMAPNVMAPNVVAPNVSVKPVDSIATDPSTPSSPVTARPSPLTEPNPATPATPLNAKVELTEKAWLKVEVDGKKVYEGVLSKGSAKSWSAGKTLKIRSGNAGAVNLSVNQAAAKPLGNIGEVKEVVLNSQP